MFAEDLAELFDTEDFAVAATFAETTTVHVIFDAAYLLQLGVAGTSPAALGRAADFPAAETVGSALAIAGVTYTITDRQPQDDGALVVLQLQAD